MCVCALMGLRDSKSVYLSACLSGSMGENDCVCERESLRIRMCICVEGVRVGK